MTPSASIRYRAILQYDGSQYRGFQRQADKTESRKSSIQAVLEDVLQKVVLSKERVVVRAAGRTDAGVHALGQVCHFDVARVNRQGEPIEPWQCGLLKKALNYQLPASIYIPSIDIVDASFDSQKSAIAREYIYKIYSTADGSGRPFYRNRQWIVHRNLSFDALRQACDAFIGSHDLTALRAASDDTSPIRVINQFEIHRLDDEPNADREHVFYIARVRAKSFMMHQVRKMVGCVVRAGAGIIDRDFIKNLIDSKDPLLCPQMAPPEGLYLNRVIYPDTIKSLQRSIASFDEMTIPSSRDKLSGDLVFPDVQL